MLTTRPPWPPAIIALTAACVASERAADVELVDPVPRVARVLLGVEEDLAGAAADAVDDDVEPAEALDGGRDDPLALGLARHVGAQREDLGARPRGASRRPPRPARRSRRRR